MSETSCPEKTPALLSPWRRLCQWCAALLVLLIPWIHINGKSLLRIDIPELSLYFFGQTVRIEELYLVLLFSLALTCGFLLITMLLGRVWCGWLCPQTTLTDLIEWFTTRLGLQKNNQRIQESFARKLVLQIGNLFLALLVSANLLWYFIAPESFFSKLLAGQLHYASWIFLLVVALVIYLDLALVRRLVCRDFCPYGRFQTTLASQETLTLHLPESELERCIKCGSCVRVCPMQIDIRNGEQIECINCGRCLDACRQVMSRRNQPGLIRYTFGTSGAGVRVLLNVRTLLLSLATLVLLAIFIFAIYQKPSASLKISVSHSAANRILEDGTRVTFFNAWLNNRGSTSAVYHIAARLTETGQPLELKGQINQLELQAGENLRVDFVLVTVVPETRVEVEFILLDQNGAEITVTEAYIK